MAGEVDGFDLEVSEGEDLVVGQEAVEGDGVFIGGYAVARAEELLHFSDSLADTDIWPRSGLDQLGLEI